MGHAKTTETETLSLQLFYTLQWEKLLFNNLTTAKTWHVKQFHNHSLSVSDRLLHIQETIHPGKLTKILYILRGNNRLLPPDSKSSHKTCYCYHLLHCEGRRMSALQNTLCSTLFLRQCAPCWMVLSLMSNGNCTSICSPVISFLQARCSLFAVP